MIDFKPAKRKQIKIRGGAKGPSGSGKTVSLLKIAYGMTGDWSKVALCDTEQRRALAYAETDHTGVEIGEFLHFAMDPPYSPARFIEVIEACEKLAVGVLIIDSFSKEWDYLLAWNQELGGEFRHWKKPKEEHARLMNRIQESSIHVLCSFRVKQGYAIEQTTNSQGRTVNQPVKMGLEVVTEGMTDYEFHVIFDIDHKTHVARVDKDNTGLFTGMEERLEPRHGEMIRAWTETGEKVKSIAEQRKEKEEARLALVDKIQNWMENGEVSEKVRLTEAQPRVNRKLDEWPESLLHQFIERVIVPLEEITQENISDTKKKAPQKEEPIANNNILDQIAKHLDDHQETVTDFLKKNSVEHLDDLSEPKRELLLKVLQTKAKQKA